MTYGVKKLRGLTEKINKLQEQLLACKGKTPEQRHACFCASLELCENPPNFPYIHNLLAQAWGLPLLKANGR
jgi:hypothetical protein